MNNKYLIFSMAFFLTTMVFVSGCGNKSDSNSDSGSPSSDSLKSKQHMITLKFSTEFNEKSTQYAGFKKMADIVSEKTNGNFQIKIYASGVLGTDRENAEGLKMGTTDMSSVPPTVFSNMDPRLNIFNLPFIFNDKEHVYKTVDGEIGKKIYGQFEDQTGIKILATYDAGFRNIANTKREIKSPEDIKGLKIRAIDAPINVDMLRAIGANPVPMPWSEVYTALQQGTVDGADMPIGNMYSFRIYEVAKYYHLTGLYFATHMMGISKKAWDQLPSDYQKILVEAAIEGQNFQRKLLDDEEKKYIESFKQNGVKVTEVSKEEKQKYREMVKSVWEKYEEIVGADVIDAVVNLAQ